MSVKTVYTCDKCGADCDDGSELWWIHINITNAKNPHSSYGNPASHRTSWCRQCCALTGVAFMQDLHKKLKVEDKPPPQPTFEDIFRNIVSEMIAEQMPPRNY